MLLTRLQATLATFVVLSFFFAPPAWAAPHSVHVKRSSSGGGSKIIAPIIAALVFLIAIPMVFFRNTLLSKLRHLTVHSMFSRRTQARTTVRDLTAEEVAGTDATNQATEAAAARTERRTRRNRRTPSQISTRSLPAYMKEPGELELVIIQGSQDLEDAPLTTQVVMPSVREDEDESANSHSRSSHSRNPSQASYVIVNDNAHVQTPLLHPDESNEITHELANPNLQVSPPSMDISDLRYNGSSSPAPNNPVITDPRGEAPPYFEVVTDLPGARATSGELARVETTDTLPIAPDTLLADSAANPPVRRRSMFRGLIDAASRALSSPHSATQPQPHSRPSRDMAVSPSPRPSNLSNRAGGTRSPPMSHRTMPSNSGSVLSNTSAFGRVASRAQSRSVANVTGGLASSSTISITSISAPLTHTAVRTDFVYPRTGPTPEQLKLISSVESVSKFGVPYGPDAVAYASASLVNLHGPPPGFEELASTDGLPGPSGIANRPRATSALSRMSRDDNAPESRISMSSLSSTESAIVLASEVDEPEATASRLQPEIRSPLPEPEPSEDKKDLKANSSVGAVPPRVPSPSPTVETISTAVTVTRAAVSGLGSVPESPHDAVASVSHETVLRSVSAEVSTGTPPTRDPVPPSSFRMPSALPDSTHTRYASRSSSVDSFCTAVSGHEQTRESDHGISDAEQDTDAFIDAQSGAETEVETPPVTPHAVSVEGTILRAGPPSLSV